MSVADPDMKTADQIVVHQNTLLFKDHHNYNHTHNPLIALCQKNQCQLITGDHLFYHQARAQQIYWQQK